MFTADQPSLSPLLKLPAELCHDLHPLPCLSPDTPPSGGEPTRVINPPPTFHISLEIIALKKSTSLRVEISSHKRQRAHGGAGELSYNPWLSITVKNAIVLSPIGMTALKVRLRPINLQISFNLLASLFV